MNDKTGWQGWAKLDNARKWHWFKSTMGNTSLCGKYMVLRKPAMLEEERDDDPNNCPMCMKRLSNLKAKTPGNVWDGEGP